MRNDRQEVIEIYGGEKWVDKWAGNSTRPERVLKDIIALTEYRRL